MASATDLLRRCLGIVDQVIENDDDEALVQETRAFLKEYDAAPVAEMKVSIWRKVDPKTRETSWYAREAQHRGDNTAMIRLRVPRHIHAPEAVEGEVAE